MAHTTAEALADGVEELVAKEKALFELEMMAKERELKDLRAKYEELAATAGEFGATAALAGAQPGGARFSGEEDQDPGAEPSTAEQHWKMVRLAGAARRTSAGLRPPRTAYARRLMSLHALDLSAQNIGQAELAHLNKQVLWLGTLKRVDLSDNRIGEDCAREIVELMGLNLRHINLSRNRLGAACARAVTQALQRNETLEVLDLSENPLGRLPHAGVTLGQAVRENAVCALRDLRVSMHDYPYGVSRRHHRPLHNAASLATLLLKPLPKGEKRGRAFNRNRESRSKTLQSLTLCHAHLARRTVETLAHFNEALTHLDLRGSFLGPSGALVLARWLARPGHHSSMTSLDLRHASLTPVGGEAIARMLGSNRWLTNVNLSNNELDDSTADRLGKALSSNRVLTALPLDRNDIRTPGGLQLMRGLRRNTSLTDLGDVFSLRLPVNLAAALDGRVRASLEQRAAGETSNLILYEHEDDAIRAESPLGHVLMIDGIVDYDGFIRVSFEARVIHAGSANRSDCFAWRVTRDSDPDAPALKQGSYRDGLVRGQEPNVTQFRQYSVVLPRWESGGEFCLWMRACDALGNGNGSGAGTRLVVQSVVVTQELDVSHNRLYEHAEPIEAALTRRGRFAPAHAIYVAHAGSLRLLFEARVSVVSPTPVIPGFRWRVGRGGPAPVAEGSHEDGLDDSRRADALHWRKFAVVVPNCAIGDRVELAVCALEQPVEDLAADPNVVFAQQEWHVHVRDVALFLEESEGGKVANTVQLQFAGADPFSVS